MAQFLPAIPSSLPCVLVDHDPVNPATDASALLAPLERRAWRRLALAAARRASAVVVFTERDRAAVAGESRPARVVQIPLGYELPAGQLDPGGTSPREIVYIGSFLHPPNVDAARWLALDIFPSVRRRVPAASLRLVGSYPSPEVLALAGDGVSVEGDVADVAGYLDAAAVFAASIRSGGGMRVKVLEAFSAGKAVVATPRAVEGLDVQSGKQAVIAETETEFVAALVELLEDAERRVTIARSAREWAERNLDLGRRVRAYETLYEEILG